jgi:hypothetical protein
MYHDLKSRYWWYGMKRAIAEYVALCDNCQRVKAERQRPAGLLQPLKIPEWKWEEISMDFIVCLHGVLKKIVSDRGIQFTSKFWEKLHESMDKFSLSPSNRWSD